MAKDYEDRAPRVGNLKDAKRGDAAVNRADKQSFRKNNDRAKAGFFPGARRSEDRNRRESGR